MCAVTNPPSKSREKAIRKSNQMPYVCVFSVDDRTTTRGVIVIYVCVCTEIRQLWHHQPVAHVLGRRLIHCDTILFAASLMWGSYIYIHIPQMATLCFNASIITIALLCCRYTVIVIIQEHVAQRKQRREKWLLSPQSMWFSSSASCIYLHTYQMFDSMYMAIRLTPFTRLCRMHIALPV